ncbi:MAG: hypothetical protein HYY45_05350 [Deltaproteobacteria bacterium]|nr:hypothetical protein [Deltaproteobacteria bacterium]
MRIAESGDRVLCEGAGGWTINESDEYAVEQGVTQKAPLGATLTALTVGPLVSQEALYIALAKGADKAVRIDSDISDPQRLAGVMARAVEKLGYDLILTGVESSDYLGAQVGTLLATRMGIASAYAVTAVEFSPDRKSIRVTKELRGGASQYLEMGLPALLSIQYGMHPLSYVSPRRLLSARSQPQETLTLPELGLDVGGRPGPFQVLEVGVPQRVRRVKFLEGNSGEVTSQLLGRIRDAIR